MFVKASVSFDPDARSFTTEVHETTIFGGSTVETHTDVSLRSSLLWLLQHRCPTNLNIPHEGIIMDLQDAKSYVKIGLELGQCIHQSSSISRDNNKFSVMTVVSNPFWGLRVLRHESTSNMGALKWLANIRCHGLLDMQIPALKAQTFVDIATRL
jgi:hypothetical protein